MKRIVTCVCVLLNFFAAAEESLYTTHSEISRPIHVPVFQREPVNVPHPIPFAVPTYIHVQIPQPYPRYTRIQHPIEVPVYRVIPEIVEKPMPYTVEKPFPIEVEKPFPIEVIKKFEIKVPKPFPVHTIYYKHISEDDPVSASTTKPLKALNAKNLGKYKTLLKEHARDNLQAYTRHYEN